jgi:hypothetical protein
MPSKANRASDGYAATSREARRRTGQGSATAGGRGLEFACIVLRHGRAYHCKT